MVQGQTKPVYTATAYNAVKDQSSFKKSDIDFKAAPNQKAKMAVAGKDTKQDPWGKILKSESHFKSLHIC